MTILSSFERVVLMSLRLKASPKKYRPRIEALETRQMLAGQDLLISVYDDTAGLSVLRYNDVTYAPAPSGTVGTGDNFLYSPQGIAVAPDGSFYVSNPANPSVHHYDADGNFITAIGVGTLALPGHLGINPDDGLLYVGDIGAGRIYQIDTSSDSIVGSILLGYAPAGFDFVPDGTNDLVVGGFDTQGVIRYTSGGPVVLVNPGSGYNPLGILAEADGDVLIADSDLGPEPMDHHQILIYSAATTLTTQFINLSFPFGTGMSAGYPAQPSALMYDHDGNLLVGLSPDHNGNGAVQKYDIDDGAYIDTLVSSIGSPTGLAFIDSINSDVAGTHLFYRGSSKWNVTNNNMPGFSDDNAIAPDKTAYLPGSGTSTFANVSSYSRGINGVMVDLNGPHGTLTANDFIFKVGNNNSPNAWSPAAAPIAVTTRAGAGAGGSDRVELMWANNAIQKTWLEIVVKGNDTLGGSNTNTGLATSEVFYFGSAVGDSGSANAGAYQVTTADEISARNDPHGLGNPATISNVNDFDRDGLVGSSDQIIARNNVTNLGNQLKFLVVGAGGPFAPESGDSGIASALASSQSPTASSTAVGASPVVTTGPSASPPAGMAATVPQALGGSSRAQTSESGAEEEDLVLDALFSDLGLD
jgi:hypothetical protein